MSDSETGTGTVSVDGDDYDQNDENDDDDEQRTTKGSVASGNFALNCAQPLPSRSSKLLRYTGSSLLS